MRMLPATANAMMRNAYSSLVTSTAPTQFTATSNSILFYTGAMPTKAEIQALISDGTQFASNIAMYTRIGSLLNARVADYVGGVTGGKAAMSLNAANFPLLLSSAMNVMIRAGSTDNRSSYFTKDATPTWCIVVGCTANVLNLTTGLGDAAAVFMAVCSVGDENSGADLRLTGGKVYANSATQTDQSKAVIINDLVLKFA